MANCSFIKATDARTRARNDTLIWTEICEVQAAILTAIDANQYSTTITSGTPFTSTGAITSVTVVSGGTLYDNVEATAVIDANTTGGTGAVISPVVTGTTITDFTITNAGSGYVPYEVTATTGNLYELLDAQTQANYNGVATNGTYAGGTNYLLGEVITMSEQSTATVVSITPTGYSIYPDATLGTGDQTEADYDGGLNNGLFTAGTGYIVSEIITMNDGTEVIVQNVDGGGGVTEFDITWNALTTASTPITLTPDTNNVAVVGTVVNFNVSSVGVVPFSIPSVLTSTSGEIGTGFTLIPNTANATPVAIGAGSVLTPTVDSLGRITNVVIENGGTDYEINTPIIFTHPSPTVNATAVVSAVDPTTFAITAITITNNGEGYTTIEPLVTVTHPYSNGDFEGTVNTINGAITSITIVDGGSGYAPVAPDVRLQTAAPESAVGGSGSGAVFSITLENTPDGNVASVDVLNGGYGYAISDVAVVIPTAGDDGSGASLTLTVDANTFGTDTTVYYSVLSGQTTDVVVADQIQYVLDYFTALGYNIRAQVNPATANTLQWQIIW